MYSVFRFKCPIIPLQRPQRHVSTHSRFMEGDSEASLPDQQSITQLSPFPQHCLQITFLLSRCFSPPLPHPRGCCLDRLPTDCLAAAVIEQGCGASLRPRGAIGCIPNGQAACVWRALDESAISEWEGGKPRTTLHYRDQTFSAAAWRSFVSAPQASAVNLNVIVHQS